MRALVESLAQAGKLLLLLDALDEVSQGNGRRQKVEQEIEDFVRQNRFRECHMIVTCRTAASHRRFERFSHVQVADFDETQMKNFVAGWFNEDEMKQAAMLRELTKPENKRIKELTQTPLLLALLCIVYQDAPQAAFPQRRAEIYGRAFDVLLKTWDSEHTIERAGIYRDLSTERKKEMLANVAYETFKEGELLIPRNRLETLIRDYLAQIPNAPPVADIPADDVLQALVAQHGVFTMQARNIFSFSHFAFEEYLAAKYIVTHEAQGSIQQLMQYINEDKWQEIFLLTFDLFVDEEYFFNYFQDGLDALIADDTKLLRLFQWANEKQASVKQMVVSSTELRAAYIFLALALERGISRDQALSLAHDIVDYREIAYNFDRHPVHDQAFRQDVALIFIDVRILARDIALAGALISDQGYFFDLERVIDDDINRAIALTLALALDPNLDIIHVLDLEGDLNLWLDVGLWIYWILASFYVHHVDTKLNDGITNIHQYLIDISAELLQESLIMDLKKMLTPPLISKSTQRCKFAQDIEQLIKNQRKIGMEWDLSHVQWKKLSTYLKGVLLLVACLDVAYVDNRAAIEDRILRPPSP